MGTIARLFGAPVLIAALALGATGSHATQPVRAGLGVQQAPRSHPMPTSVPRTIVGSWDLANGIFEFNRTGRGNTFADVVIRQRPGVFCPKINDQDDQMVLHRARHRIYTGTWAWFYVGTCKFAGYGALTVTLWWDGERATFVADPPEGLAGLSHTFYMSRVKMSRVK